jgi:outer membrane lipoprotein-sorting protein
MSFLCLLLALLVTAPAFGQMPVNPESAAKAKELFARAVEALGGDAFLQVKTAQFEGRVYGFRRGDLSGLAQVVQYIGYPDRSREEYGEKKEEIHITNGDKGWMIDINGVHPEPEEEMKSRRESRSMRAFYVLRYRLGEEGSIVEYVNRDIWENREVDVVRFVDKDNGVLTFSLDASTALPARTTWVHRDPQTRERIEEVETFGNYFTRNGIATPRRTVRLRNGTRVFEAVIRQAQFNVPHAESLFQPPPG